MTTPADIVALARSDGRFAPEAFFFVLESLNYAQEVLHLGTPAASEAEPEGKKAGGKAGGSSGKPQGKAAAKAAQRQRHVSGKELCEAIRQYALEQFGLMAGTVFKQWRVGSTSDFGEIVFAMVEAGQMSKTAQDRREDFDGHYDFGPGLTGSFRITMPSETAE